MEKNRFSHDVARIVIQHSSNFRIIAVNFSLNFYVASEKKNRLSECVHAFE